MNAVVSVSVYITDQKFCFDIMPSDSYSCCRLVLYPFTIKAF